MTTNQFRKLYNQTKKSKSKQSQLRLAEFWQVGPQGHLTEQACLSVNARSAVLCNIAPVLACFDGGRLVASESFGSSIYTLHRGQFSDQTPWGSQLLYITNSDMIRMFFCSAQLLFCLFLLLYLSTLLHVFFSVLAFFSLFFSPPPSLPLNTDKHTKSLIN